MKIYDEIFNEMLNLDVQEFINLDSDPDLGFNEYNLSIYDEMCAKAQFNKPFGELSSDEEEELDREQFIKVKRIPLNSLLFRALRYWYRTWGHSQNTLANYVRGGYVDDDYLYYGTGIGYDTTSSDLLGCECDGQARDAFLDFCNEPEDVMDRGGFEYMKSKGLERSISSKLRSIS